MEGELFYTVEIEAAEEGGFVASVPALPGCHTQGATIDEVISRIKEAIEGFILGLANRGQKIPVERESKPPFTFSIAVRARLPA